MYVVLRVVWETHKAAAQKDVAEHKQWPERAGHSSSRRNIRHGSVYCRTTPRSLPFESRKDGDGSGAAMGWRQRDSRLATVRSNPATLHNIRLQCIRRLKVDMCISRSTSSER